MEELSPKPRSGVAARGLAREGHPWTTGRPCPWEVSVSSWRWVDGKPQPRGFTPKSVQPSLCRPHCWVPPTSFLLTPPASRLFSAALTQPLPPQHCLEPFSCEPHIWGVCASWVLRVDVGSPAMDPSG